MSHTPEPWRTLKCSNDEGYLIRGESEYLVAEVDNKANAARIVSCINGCAGLNPTAYRDVISALARLVVGVTKQSSTTCDWYEGILGDALDEAQQAIAHAQGQEG